MPAQNSIPNGLKRFQIQLQLMQTYIDQANKSENPALELYTLNARTPLFMLEALTRVYEKMHNKKIFGKQKVHFKLLEDMLGAVDYYDAFYKQIQADKTIPASIKKFLKNKTEEKLSAINQFLVDEGWIGEENRRLKKIAEKLNKVEWLAEEQETAAITKVYEKAIADIKTDIAEQEINFDNVEEDVHELRRKLRWLSIYPQCFNGLFQLKKSKTATASQKKYLTKDILNSPYNKMPAKGKIVKPISLDSNNFYALSWMISKLGTLKDSGLRYVVLHEAVLGTTQSSEKQAQLRAIKLCGAKQPATALILSQAKKLSDLFFKEDVLGGLIVS